MLAEALGLREEDIGYAGLKDKAAVAVQTFSLYLPHGSADEAARTAAERLPVEVSGVSRHTNKLKPGHLLGNSFQVIAVGTGEEGLERARAVAEALAQRGLPNYYGFQRFGQKGDNAQRGREVLAGGGGRKGWLHRFLISAFQAELFNQYLAERIGLGWWDRLLAGDVAKKTDTGGLFDVEDEAVEADRYRSGAITFTGPIYGAKMRPAGGEPGALEKSLLEREGVTEAMFKKARASGSRRAGRLNVNRIEVASHPLGLVFNFALPKGSYATTLLREFIKSEPDLPED